MFNMELPDKFVEKAENLLPKLTNTVDSVNEFINNSAKPTLGDIDEFVKKDARETLTAIRKILPFVAIPFCISTILSIATFVCVIVLLVR
ncbi:hypothetical protein [uncultured Treponema sp.]|uniref:hypothetical protein n=1 Tax=uncultured Treponema sp. TaxID=162155 RepID=UPI0025FFABA8|nr:hypothetical protein [uncultured Treponema sp.]